MWEMPCLHVQLVQMAEKGNFLGFGRGQGTSLVKGLCVHEKCFLCPIISLDLMVIVYKSKLMHMSPWSSE